MPRLRTRLVALTAALVTAATAGAYVAASQPAAEAAASKPNIIYFLVDDMSAELLDYTHTIAGLADGGTTFADYYVSNSLCCPSRASMFTGDFPHNTHVLTNKGSDRGGYPAFLKYHNERRTYAPALHDLGYRTGYLGKYLNEYKVTKDYRVPVGWDEWHVSGGGYDEFDYKLTRYIPAEGTGKQVTQPKGKYLVDVLGDRAARFIARSREHTPNKPFFLQVATFSPHSRVSKDGPAPRFPPAVRDRPKDKWPKAQFPHGDCGGPDCAGIDVKTLPAFNETPIDDKPSWLRDKPKITNPVGCKTDPQVHCLLTELRNDFRNRIRMMQSLDEMVATVLTALTPAERRNTYIIFGSDNGFHLGQHRLPRGKTTAYDHDIRVPLLVRSPVSAGTLVNRQIVQNVDIYPTLVDIANGAQPGPTGRDGRSLLPLINGQTPANWRNAALIEHVRPNLDAAGAPDPDYEALAGRGTPTYRAVRTPTELLVRYAIGQNGEYEYYDTAADPNELDNKPQHPRVADLRGPLDRLAACGTDGHPDCWTAAHLD